MAGVRRARLTVQSPGGDPPQVIELSQTLPGEWYEFDDRGIVISDKAGRKVRIFPRERVLLIEEWTD